MNMKIEYIGKDQDWNAESTTYWYETEIGRFGILDQNGSVDIVGECGGIVSDSSTIYILCCAADIMRDTPEYGSF